MNRGNTLRGSQKLTALAQVGSERKYIVIVINVNSFIFD
jgi:hypothetical protein